jgi:magnesium chelatase subunit H
MRAEAAESISITIVTLDGHLGRSIERVQNRLQADIPNLSLSIHPASDWENDTDALARCHADIAKADIIVCTMLFMEPHIQAVLPALRARLTVTPSWAPCRTTRSCA